MKRRHKALRSSAHVWCKTETINSSCSNVGLHGTLGLISIWMWRRGTDIATFHVSFLFFGCSFSPLSASLCWQGYYFHTDNPYKDLPNAFEEGLKKSREGDLQNAVLLLEAAVLQDPHDSEVNPFNTANAGALAATIMLELFKITGRAGTHSWGMRPGQKEEPASAFKAINSAVPWAPRPDHNSSPRLRKVKEEEAPTQPQSVSSRTPWLPRDAFICLSLEKLFTVVKKKKETFSWWQFPSVQTPVSQIMAHSAGFFFFCCSFTLCVSQEMTSWQAEGAKPSHTKCSQKSPGIHRNVPVIPRRGLSRSVWN